MKTIIITAIGGRDKPGIVAALTKAVLDVGGNLDDATMTRLHGAFATMIAATLPDGREPSEVKDLLAPVAIKLDLHVAVEEIPADARRNETADHIISVYGADHPGIVYRITALLASAGANITDLDTRLVGTSSKPVYIMLLETSGGDWSRLSDDLPNTAKQLGVDITVRERDAESL